MDARVSERKAGVSCLRLNCTLLLPVVPIKKCGCHCPAMKSSIVSLNEGACVRSLNIHNHCPHFVYKNFKLRLCPADNLVCVSQFPF